MQILIPMNKLKVATPRFVAINLLMFLCTLMGYAHTNPDADEAYLPAVPRFSESLIKHRLNNLSSVLDIKYTPEVGRRIKEYTVSYRVAGERILGKVDLYFPLFDEELAKRDLPEELKYIAIVESNLNPYAKSKSGASGMWQFMKATARLKGLVVNDKLDERRCPERSTKAALDYLSEMYDIFGDWTLTMAAYNCGPGGVKKAIRKSGGKTDYWSVRKFLPKETQKYIPRVIAAMYLMQYYQAHNLKPDSVNRHLSQVVNITDGKRHNFKKLAEDLNIDYKVLMNLNPQFRTGYFNEYNGTQELTIPHAKYDNYLELYDYAKYRELLIDRREKEITNRREVLLSKDLISRLTPLEPIIYRRLKHKRKKKVYRTAFSEWRA